MGPERDDDVPVRPPPIWPAPTGREEVREYLKGYTTRVDITSIRHQRRHEAQDPDTLVLEWGVDGVGLSTGRRYAIDFVAFVTVQEAGITAYRDYWNPLAAGHATGTLETMLAALTAVEGGTP